MKGYRELRKEVEDARKNMKEVELLKYKKEKSIQTSFYKSPVGTRHDRSYEVLYILLKKP